LSQSSSHRLLPADAALATEKSEQSRWFAEEIQPHESRLRGWLQARFPSWLDIDDVLHEAYLRLFRARTNGGVRSTRALLYVAARNAACDFFRKQKTDVVERVEDISALCVLEERPDAADAAASQQELEMLADAIRTLPARCRQVFTLRKIYGLSQREIGERLGISESTVEAQVCKGTVRCAAFMHARGLGR
jgi:RNA polymerase sigma factor (sigma-70 family)